MSELILILLGLVGLSLGSDLAVEAAREIARKLRVSELTIGLTITSIGTSLPEIFTNIMSGLSTRAGVDASGIAVGNIIGSELAQITLLLGITGFIATLTMPMKALRRDGFMLVIALLLMYATAIDGHVTRGEGLILVATYIAYLVYIFTQEKKSSDAEDKMHRREYNITLDTIKVFVGLIIVIYCADVIVGNGVSLATKWGITESIIGLFVGLGTSMPELSVSIRAVLKKSGELSLGNLIGSNITDPLFSFGIGAVIAGFNVSQTVLKFDFVFWLAATLVALLLLYNHLDLNRKESTVLMIFYILFMYIRLTFFAV
ncbi:MAG: calcium/sodium antiporter [Candidatus Altiarchaeota archaeon]